MKHLAAYLVTLIVAWIAWHDDRAPELIPEWVLMVVAPLILTLPLTLLAHLLTRKIDGPKSRVVDLVILFVVVGAYWALSFDYRAHAIIDSPGRFWFGLTVNSWATFFLPFSATLGVIEAWKARRTKAVPQIVK
jgi:hypothetical protein